LGVIRMLLSYGLQDEILDSILTIHKIVIEFDPTYSRGIFYKNKVHPKIMGDKFIQVESGVLLDACNLPFASCSIGSIMFDPPFMVKQPTINNTSIMSNRFSSFPTIKERDIFYKDSITELNRVLKPKNYLIVKCQDSIDNHRFYNLHQNICTIADTLGLVLEDIGICISNHVLPRPNLVSQEHLRKGHSYFLVFSKPKLKFMQE
jgi:hypothetical protein